MEKSGFFGSNSHDRVYKTAIINKFFSKLYTNGIFNNGCIVKSNDNMTITIAEGWALINGCWYYNDSDKILSLSLADANQSRIDNVVLRYTTENRIIEANIVEGTYADTPTAPPLERSNAIYDLRIAEISVSKGIDKITTAMIKDTRFNSNDCGQVIGAVQQLDSTDIFQQYQAIFDAFMSTLKDTLSGDVAGNLQNEINVINSTMVTVKEISDEDLKNYL